MHILAGHETASQLDEFTRVDLSRSAALLLVLGGDPAALDDDSSSVDADGVAREVHLLFHGDFTTFVAVEGVDHIVASDFLSLDRLSLGNEHLFGVVELSNDEVGSESVIDSPLFLRHAPPCEVHLLPWRAVGDRLVEELVVGFRALECLLHVLTVVEVGEETRGETGEDGTFTHQVTLLGRHPLDQLLCVHIYSLRIKFINN